VRVEDTHSRINENSSQKRRDQAPSITTEKYEGLLEKKWTGVLRLQKRGPVMAWQADMFDMVIEFLDQPCYRI
jgi:hypothetical protein